MWVYLYLSSFIPRFAQGRGAIGGNKVIIDDKDTATGSYTYEWNIF